MDKEDVVSKSIKYLTCFFIIQAFILLIFSRLLSYYKSPSFFNIIFYIFVLLNFVLIIFLVFKWLHSIEKTTMGNKQNLKMLRLERHDYLNHLQSVFGLAVTGDKKEVIDYLSELGANTRFSTQIMNFNNSALQVLLLTKKDELVAKDIELKLVIQSTMDHFIMSPCDITTVFGNLFKNAMDVLVSSTGGVQKRLIIFEATETDTDYVFKVKDSGPQIPEDIIDHIFSEGFSTKGSERGFGLSLVKRTVEKYSGFIVYSPYPKGFTITIPRIKKQNIFKNLTLPKLCEGKKGCLVEWSPDTREVKVN